MPELNLRDIRKDLRFPELRLPEMSRDDIAKALGEARKEMQEVRKDLNDFRREFEVPKVDVSAVEMPRIDLSKVDLEKVSKDARKMSKDARKNARQAAQKAGLVKGPSRIPFVLVGLATLGLVAWALATPGVKARLQEAARQIRERMDEQRNAWERDDETRAFDAAETAGVTPNAYADSIDAPASPFAEPPTGLPERLGDNGAHKIEGDEPARA
jgi:Sec-independent protein translocase protein TatA